MEKRGSLRGPGRDSVEISRQGPSVRGQNPTWGNSQWHPQVSCSQCIAVEVHV